MRSVSLAVTGARNSFSISSFTTQCYGTIVDREILACCSLIFIFPIDDLNSKRTENRYLFLRFK